jgi:hypothetical protein
MGSILDFLKMLPASVRWGAIVGLLVVGIAYGHEVRYMTVGQFTKSYVLDLKSLIREFRNDLKDPTLTPREREDIEEDIAALLDELCYEMPNDPECKGR